MIRQFVKQLPGMRQLVESNLWRTYRHSLALRDGPRVNSNFTGFWRLPTQFEALTGPVVALFDDVAARRPLRIASAGCSNGAEAYTVASFLIRRHPYLEFTVHAFDLDEAIVEKAATASFLPEQEVYCNRKMTQEFVEATFDVSGDHYVVKPEIRRHVSFTVADALDRDALSRLGRMDIVLAQNFLFHLEPADAARALDNICLMLNDRAALLLDGTDLPLRQRHTRKHGLEPLDWQIEQIHNEARWARGEGWPYRYWGLEPFMTSRRDWRRRYATIFIKDER